MTVNYQREMDKLLDALRQRDERPTLLLHSCCAPCSSYVIEYLSGYFALTVFYCNPNIQPAEEYEKRKAEQLRLIELLREQGADIRFLDCGYDPGAFDTAAAGLERAPEGGERCRACFALRLQQTAEAAHTHGFDWFATTLTVSPHKNAQLVNEAGAQAGEETGARYLASDFKKKNGYKRSLELSRQHALYRQNDCGCRFSRAPAQ